VAQATSTAGRRPRAIRRARKTARLFILDTDWQD
jgi:hypothetical protein